MITIIIITIIIVIIKCRSRCRTLTATKTELSVTYNGPKPATMTKNSTSDTAWVLHAPLKRLIHHLTRGIYIYIYIYINWQSKLKKIIYAWQKDQTR